MYAYKTVGRGLAASESSRESKTQKDRQHKSLRGAKKEHNTQRIGDLLSD
jgi:hypothetical protein